jgi:hypothetical protein
VSGPGPELVGDRAEISLHPLTPPPPVVAPPPAVAPYHPPPAYPPPSLGRAAPADGRAITSLALAVLGIVLGLPFGLPGLVLGAVAYFTGKAALARIDESNGTIGGRSLASAGWVLGVVATAIGAIVSLTWLVVLLVVISAPST